MTEAEWIKSFNPQAMLALVRDKGTDRLWRLLAVACLRGAERQMRYPESRKAIEVAERFADGRATQGELRVARTYAEAAARQAHEDEWEDEVRANFCWDADYAAMVEARKAADAALSCVADTMDPSSIPEGLLLPDLLREVFGNPFHWCVVDPIWLTSNDGIARKLAQTIYDRRDFHLSPILADALEDAGCMDADLLEHLRSPGPHVRGCWALDLILTEP